MRRLMLDQFAQWADTPLLGSSPVHKSWMRVVTFRLASRALHCPVLLDFATRTGTVHTIPAYIAIECLANSFHPSFSPTVRKPSRIAAITDGFRSGCPALMLAIVTVGASARNFANHRCASAMRPSF